MAFKAIHPKKDPFEQVPRNVDRAIKALYAAALESQHYLQLYPPQSPEVTYQRTGDLGRKWYTTAPMKRGRDIVVQVGNTSLHFLPVQGPLQVALFKAYGWRNVKDAKREVLDKRMPQVRAILQKGQA